MAASSIDSANSLFCRNFCLLLSNIIRVVNANHMAEEIQVEPLHSERTRFRPQQRRTKGTEVVSPYSVLKIGSRTKTAASDPSVFVFPYGQADRIENQSFAFYSGQPNSDRSTILQ